MDKLKECPNCGISTEDAGKFCPACGTPLKAEEPDPQPVQEDAPQPDADEAAPDELVSADPPREDRVFILREKKYGDTAEFSDPDGIGDKESEQPTAAGKSNLSLYISIFAAVLAITAIVLVVIFAVIPEHRRSDAADTASDATTATAAPTQAPTEPPIAGVYRLSSIQGEKNLLFSMLVKDGQINMAADYTGTLTVGGTSLSDVTLDKDGDTAVFLGADCTYTFDGSTLTIEYGKMTLVFKKA